MQCPNPSPRPWMLLPLVLSCVVCLGFSCSEREVQDFLADGTEFTFRDQQRVDYVLVLDRSGSMRGDRIEQLTLATSVFVSQLRRGDRAAIIGFDHEPVLYSGYTDDTEALMHTAQSITVGGWTRYNPALGLADTLASPYRKVIVFMSDGEPDDDSEDIRATVRSLVDKDVCLFTVAYTDDAAVTAQMMLQEMADLSIAATGCGGYYRASENTFDLRFAFDDIYKTVSSDQLLAVTADITYNGATRISSRVQSLLNQRNIEELVCAQPRYSYTVLRNRQVMYERTTEDSFMVASLPAGEYTFVLSVVEDCGGACYFTGKTEGRFTVDPARAACDALWEEMFALLTSKEYVEVHITEDGFSPQTVGTDGIVVWKNFDRVPRQVISMDGSFVSPVLQPGESWTKVFPPGTYTYGDKDATISGMLRHEERTTHTPVDLVFVLDKSGSMMGEPLLSAKEAALNLLRIMSPRDRVALVTFSDEGHVVQALTTDQVLLRHAVQSVRSEGSTFYIDPLRLAGQQLRMSGSSRSSLVMFLSDGVPYDAGGVHAILNALDMHLGDACFYAIGYGQEGLEARELLQAMADHVQARNGCGLFYYSTESKVELSRVFGEIYALTQEPGLEIYDLNVPEEPSSEFLMTLRVRSLVNGVSVPSTHLAGCVPPAEVVLVVAGKSFPFVYQHDRYEAHVTLPPGEYSGVLNARVRAEDDPVRVIVGQTPVTLRVKGSLWSRGMQVAAGGLFVLLLGYVFMRRRAP